MKLKNAVVGLQVFVKDVSTSPALSFFRGRVGVIVETDRINTGNGQYELSVKFSDGKSDTMNACDVRKATLDDAGVVVQVLKDSSSKGLLNTVRRVAKPLSITGKGSLVIEASNGWIAREIGDGNYWHVDKENVTIVSTVADFLSASQ